MNQNTTSVVTNSQAKPVMDQEAMLAEIHQFTRQTRNYMRWQIYITIVLVVLPLLTGIALMVMTLKSLGAPANLSVPGGTLTQ